MKGSSSLSLWWLSNKKNLPLGLIHWQIERDTVHLFTFERSFCIDDGQSVSQSSISLTVAWGDFFFHTTETSYTPTKRWNVAEKERKRKGAIWINAIICTRTSKRERDTSTMKHPTEYYFSFSFFIHTILISFIDFNFISYQLFSALIKLINCYTLAKK